MDEQAGMTERAKGHVQADGVIYLPIGNRLMLFPCYMHLWVIYIPLSDLPMGPTAL